MPSCSFPGRLRTLNTLIPAATALMLSAGAQAQLQLEEVIVTAQKRAQNLQDVPISVSAVQGDKLESAGIGNMAALADHVPNLYIADAPVNTNIYMRGMGSGNNQAFEQSVGMYIDGVYMGRGRQYRSPFMDVDRVEVLRGPQGTLFGKNTVAGAINITTRSAAVGDEFGGSVALSVEENGGAVAEGYLTGGVGENTALRLAFKHKQTDGYAENLFLETDEPEVEETVIRLSGVWQASEELDFNLKLSHSTYERTGVASGATLYIDQDTRTASFPNRSAFANIAYLLTDSFYADQLAAGTSSEFTIVKDNGFGPDSTGVDIGLNPESSDNESNNFVLTANYQLENHTVTSITGYSAYEFVDNCDCDWLPLQFISRDDDQEFSQLSQEIRIASDSEGFFTYVAGAYYEQSDLEIQRRVTIDLNMDGLVQQTIGLASLTPAIVPGYTANQLGRSHFYQLDTDSWAVFGQGTFNISDRVRATVGLRYTEESKDAISQQFLFDDLGGLGVRNDDPRLATVNSTSFDAYTYN